MNCYYCGASVEEDGYCDMCEMFGRPKAIVNLTPHAINFVNDGKVYLTVPPSGRIARCAVKRKQTGTINGIPVNKTVLGKAEDLPQSEYDTIYIVSSIVAQAVPEREDVYIPDDTVRDAAGVIIGCKGIAHI